MIRAMTTPPEVGLSGCRIARPTELEGRVEIVTAEPAARTFPTRVSAGLGVCLKYGATHEVLVDGRRASYPTDSVSLRAPGCVWASGEGVHGFLSLDVAPELLPADGIRGTMAFVGRHALPDLRMVARRLAVADDDLQAGEVVADLVAAVLATGALESEALRDSAGPRDAVDTARDFLAANLDGRPTLDDTASAAGVTKFTLLRRFRRSLGTTPHAYLIMLRLTRAQRMLAEGWTPAAAAAGAGFADQAHLGRWFRRSLGVTPAGYSGYQQAA
jgi:AraC-like DNA-binding protein